MGKLSKDDYENYHREKIDKKDVLKQKIQLQIQKHSTDSPPIVVPNGLQEIYTSWYVPKPLQCSYGVSSSTHDLFVAHYGAGPVNGMCKWNSDNDSYIIKQEKHRIKARITNFTFISSRNVFFASCTDLSLRSYGYDFQLHNKHQLNHSVLSMIYDEDLDIVTTGSVGLIEQWRISKSQQDPPDLLNQTIVEDNVSGVKPWINFLYSYKQEHRLIALSANALFILDEETLEQIAFLENRHQYPLTVCVAYSRRQYLITSSEEGSIKVWNMYMRSFPYVGSFKGHTSSIMYLTIHPTHQLLISASSDSTIRFWRIETFHEMYRYNIIDVLKSVHLVNAKRLFYTTTKHVQVLELNISHSLFTLIGSNIINISRIKSCVKPTRILVIGEDGGARIVSPVHGNILTTIFPITTHKATAYHHDPIEEKVYVILEEGDVMVISTKTNPCNCIQIWQAYNNDEKVVSMALYHRQIREGVASTLLIAARADGRIGLLRGKGLKPSSIESSRGIIEKIIVCTASDNNVCDLFTFNCEGIVTLWNLTIEKKSMNLMILQDLFFDEKADIIEIMSNVILLATKEKLLFVKLNKTDGKSNVSLEYHQPTKDVCHLTNVTFITSCRTLSIFATCSDDGCLKVWNTHGCLIRELSFDKTLSGLCFANDRGDLLVGFQDNVHYVGVMDYLPSRYLKQILDLDLSDDETEYCIPFDPILKFWYDPNRVDCISLSLAHVKTRSPNHLSNAYLPRISESQCSSEDSITGSDYTDSETDSTIMKQQQRMNLLRNRVKAVEVINVIKRLSTLDRGNEIINQIMKSQEIPHELEPVQEISSERDLNVKFWPCAPDGYIPNSIVREGFEIKPPPPETLTSWKPGYIADNDSDDDVPIILEDSEDENDRARVWLSDDDDDLNMLNSAFANRDSFTSHKPMHAIKSIAKVEPPQTKPTASGNKEPKPTTPKLVKVVKTIVEEKKVKLPSTNVVKENLKEVELIPYPFDRYHKETWFPRGIGFEPNTVVSAIIKKCTDESALNMTNMIQCIVKAHRLTPLDDGCLDDVLKVLFDLLNHKDGIVRHLAVKTLCDLGINRKDVVIKLIRSLDDPFEKVKQQVKETLKRFEGIVNADTLVATLKKFGEFKEETPTPNDTVVLETFREVIVNKGDDFKDRLGALYARFDRTDSKMTAWVEHMLQPVDMPAKRKFERKRKEKETLGYQGYNEKENKTSGYKENEMSGYNNNSKTELPTIICKINDENEEPGGMNEIPEIVCERTENIDNADTEYDYHNANICDDKNITTSRNMNLLRRESAIDQAYIESISKKPSRTYTNSDEHNNKNNTKDNMISIPHMNERLYSDLERTVSEAIVDVAPNLGRRFKSIKSDEDILKYRYEHRACDSDTFSDTLPIIQKEVKNRQRWKFSIVDQTANPLQKIDVKETVKNKVSKKKADEMNELSQNVKMLELFSVATAISALRGKRKNSVMFSQNGILSNEILNDITLLLNLLHDKNVKKGSTVKRMMKQVRQLEKDLQVQRHQSIQITEHCRMPDCGPTNMVPPSIRHNMVPGVMGERIVSSLHVLPGIDRVNDKQRYHGVMKAIPERHGNETVSRKGCTKYGAIEYNWTTYTASYDLGIRHCRQNVDKKKMLPTYRNPNQKRESFLKHARPRIITNRTPNIRGKFASADSPSLNYRLNPSVVLPKIPPGTAVGRFYTSMMNPMPPPNTADGFVRRHKKEEIYTPT